MPVDIKKYLNHGAQTRALEVLTPPKEDKGYLKLRRAFVRSADKAIAAINDGKVRGVRGNPMKFFETENRRWSALGNGGQLVTVPKSGTSVVMVDLVFIGDAAATVAFINDVKAAAEEGQFDERFKQLAGGGGGETPVRRRRGRKPKAK